MKYLSLILFTLFLSVQLSAQKAATIESAVKVNDTLQPYVEKLYTKLILSDVYQYADEVDRIYKIKIHFLMYRDELESSILMSGYIKI